MRVGRFFVIDAAAQSFVGLGKGLHRGENIGIGRVRLGCAELGYGESKSGHELLLRVDYVGREIDVEQWSFGWKGARVLVLIAVRGGQVRAIRSADDGDFAAGAAADGADGFALRGTEAVGLALFTNWTGH